MNRESGSLSPFDDKLNFAPTPRFVCGWGEIVQAGAPKRLHGVPGSWKVDRGEGLWAILPESRQTLVRIFDSVFDSIAVRMSKIWANLCVSRWFLLPRHLRS